MPAWIRTGPAVVLSTASGSFHRQGFLFLLPAVVNLPANADIEAVAILFLGGSNLEVQQALGFHNNFIVFITEGDFPPGKTAGYGLQDILNGFFILQ